MHLTCAADPPHPKVPIPRSVGSIQLLPTWCQTSPLPFVLLSVRQRSASALSICAQIRIPRRVAPLWGCSTQIWLCLTERAACSQRGNTPEGWPILGLESALARRVGSGRDRGLPRRRRGRGFRPVAVAQASSLWLAETGKMPVLRRPLSARWGTWIGERQGGFLTGPFVRESGCGKPEGLE